MYFQNGCEYRWSNNASFRSDCKSSGRRRQSKILDQTGSIVIRETCTAQFCNLTPNSATIALELDSGTLDSRTSWRSVPLIQRLRVIL